MDREMEPIVGNWYQHVDKGLDFEVVAVDEDNASVEVQFVDGTLDEIALDDWYELDLEPAEPPEDWTGPLDDVETDDADYTETDVEADDWDEPLRERPRRRGYRQDADDDRLADGWDDAFED
ncbi:MAG: hypothetical protein Kow0073_09830 [Immundisolibacter sp.]